MSGRLRTLLGGLGLFVMAMTALVIPLVPSDAAWTDQVLVEYDMRSGTWVTTTTPEPPEPPPLPIYPGDDTTTIVGVTWNPMSPVQNCATVVVGTTSDQPADWRYYIDFSDTPWHGSQPNGTWWPNRIVSGPTNEVMLVGNEPAEKIQPGTTREFIHCVDSGNTPPVVTSGAETYTYSESTLDPTTDLPYYACAVATVTGHFNAWGSPQFVGFSVPIDWAATLQQGVDDGLITGEEAATLLAAGLDYFEINGNPAIDVIENDVYILTGDIPTQNMGIKDGQQMTVRACT